MKWEEHVHSILDLLNEKEELKLKTDWQITQYLPLKLNNQYSDIKPELDESYEKLLKAYNEILVIKNIIWNSSFDKRNADIKIGVLQRLERKLKEKVEIMREQTTIITNIVTKILADNSEL